MLGSRGISSTEVTTVARAAAANMLSFKLIKHSSKLTTRKLHSGRLTFLEECRRAESFCVFYIGCPSSLRARRHSRWTQVAPVHQT